MKEQAVGRVIGGSMFIRNLGKAIRERRLELGVSQMEMAEEAGIHRTYLSDVERGERNITVAMLAKLAGALNISVSQLVKVAENGNGRGSS